MIKVYIHKVQHSCPCIFFHYIFLNMYMNILCLWCCSEAADWSRAAEAQGVNVILKLTMSVQTHGCI